MTYSHTIVSKRDYPPTERELRSESAKRAARRRASQGLHPTNLPLGYVPGWDGVAVPDPKTSPLVAEAIRLYATGEYSVRKLHALMAARGLRSKRGTEMSVSAFHEMLTNPFYSGYVRADRQLLQGRHQPLL